MEELNKLIGIKVKEQVEQLVALAEVNKRGRAEQGKTNSSFSLHSMFLIQGTGETTVARLVGKVLYQKKGVISRINLWWK